MAGYYDYDWRPHVTVASRKATAKRDLAKLGRDGHAVSPVVIEGRAIARSFWGQSWCENLERYSDYANRLPRGRSYVRNGSVVDLEITAGRVRALVSGSSMYTVAIAIGPLEPRRWKAIIAECAGRVGSLVDLLRGQLSESVMEVLARPGQGLFPAPREITLECSCPDWAEMCKHVAATLYGVGARLDAQPDLFFTLRQVDQAELVAHATRGGGLGGDTVAAERRLGGDASLSALFGIEVEEDAPVRAGARGSAPSAARRPASRTGKAAKATPLTTTAKAAKAAKVAKVAKVAKAAKAAKVIKVAKAINASKATDRAKAIPVTIARKAKPDRRTGAVRAHSTAVDELADAMAYLAKRRSSAALDGRRLATSATAPSPQEGSPRSPRRTSTKK